MVFRLQKEIKSRTIAYGVLAVLMAAMLGVLCLNLGVRPFVPTTEATGLATFSSLDELEDYLTTQQTMPYYMLEVSDLERMPMPAEGSAFLASGLEGVDAKSLVGDSGPEYSTTNVQVEGVDEADLVKTDGEYLYMVSGNNVTILKAYPPEDGEILSQINLNGTVRGIFVNGDRLAIFAESYYYQPVEAYHVEAAPLEAGEEAKESMPRVEIAPYWLYSTSSETCLRIYDVSNPADPSLTGQVTVNGTYFSSRMIGDYVYAVTNQPVLWYENTVVLPIIISPRATTTIQPSEIYYSSVSDNSHAFITVFAIDIKLDEPEPVHETFLLGSASCMYVSFENVYITMPNAWSSTAGWSEKTMIHRVRISDGEITWEASGDVPGRVLNQFSMDEYGEHFRIATTTGQSWDPERPSKNNVYVLNMNLNITGKLEDLAPTETIYSARFMGDKCYLVTFRQVDPFFVIDLRNPSQPEVLGTLKIPGYSSYLHPYDDDHIIGIGIDEGKMKISLLDVSNVTAPQEEAKFVTDGWSSSLALQDHKAVLFDKSRNLFVVPITNYNPAYSQGFSQGAHVFRISTEELGDKIILRGVITHLTDNAEDKIDRYYYAYQYHVRRALFIDDVLYTLSEKKVKMNDLATLQPLKDIELP